MGAATTTQPTPPWRRRLPSLAAVAYVAALALWTDGASGEAWLAAIAAGVIALVASGRRTGPARAAGWGAAVVVAAAGVAEPGRALDAASAVGLFACTAAGCIAVARVPSEGGLVASRRPSGSVALSVAVGVAAVVAWGAIVARTVPGHLGHLWLAGGWMDEHARAFAWAAILWSAAVLAGWNEWSLLQRRLELGVVERARGVRSLLAVLLVAGLLVGALGHSEHERAVDAVARLVLAAAGVVVVAASLADDAVRVARIARRAIVLGTAGAGVALLGASVAAEGRSGDVWRATLATAVISLAIGSAAALLERPLRPGQGAWLDAFAQAVEEAHRADPDDAVREVLVALRHAASLESPSPELWTFAPGRALTVDAAGYLHERDVDIPESVVMTAVAEPHATLRAHVLDELEVRRPELRVAARWLTQRSAALATVVSADGELEGVLVLPHGRRAEEPTLEEVRAFKRVADRLAAACRARGARSRMLARAQEAVARAEAAEAKTAKLERASALEPARHALATTRLARPATVGVYAFASRAALEALEQRTGLGLPLAVVAVSGVDPVPYLARAHLAGVRGQQPFVLVDATDAREHDLARWMDPAASPLVLAHGGLLVLLHGAVLPADVQQLVARASIERRAPWDEAWPLDLQLALTGVAAPSELVAEGRLDVVLASRFGDAETPVVLPRLAERPEDLRAIVTDRLAREGLRVLGRPVGIDHAAYARLMEHAFPGDDVELAAIALFLVGRCSGDVVRAADVDALRLALDASTPASGEATKDARRRPLSA